jgi:hypothetical protein
MDPDPDPELHQNNADPHADPMPSFYTCWKILFFLLLVEKSKFFTLVSALPRFNVLSFQSLSIVSYVFSIFDSILKF